MSKDLDVVILEAFLFLFPLLAKQKNILLIFNKRNCINMTCFSIWLEAGEFYVRLVRVVFDIRWHAVFFWGLGEEAVEV